MRRSMKERVTKKPNRRTYDGPLRSDGRVCPMCECPHEGEPASYIYDDRELATAADFCARCGWPNFESSGEREYPNPSRSRMAKVHRRLERRGFEPVAGYYMQNRKIRRAVKGWMAQEPYRRPNVMFRPEQMARMKWYENKWRKRIRDKRLKLFLDPSLY